jgi:hypothetical protein
MRRPFRRSPASSVQRPQTFFRTENFSLSDREQIYAGGHGWQSNRDEMRVNDLVAAGAGSSTIWPRISTSAPGTGRDCLMRWRRNRFLEKLLSLAIEDAVILPFDQDALLRGSRGEMGWLGTAVLIKGRLPGSTGGIICTSDVTAARSRSCREKARRSPQFAHLPAARRLR